MSGPIPGEIVEIKKAEKVCCGELASDDSKWSNHIDENENCQIGDEDEEGIG